ncbi:helix-turn-helix domain-containing protein [Streptomyces sp. H10-C2]|uniref:ArsR/SmtB family transcription factor n=1 Tax=unclassified Streptomyces TaxID=2593676 RepID=UPI0024BBB28F|nr:MULTISPECIES: MarR family transcriptional regulator [unclassified Streptomyces]MDJ0344431.1 helix-turn-helix domain-containing protein [Streptomyces sp. PH10-H1]MDJ0372093.1 helix-turn-helix domain-containing protein [Streptomyces sp. H10-C2]
MMFCGQQPRLHLGDAHGPPVLAYPLTIGPAVADPRPDPQSHRRQQAAALAKVLGPTRAMILRTVATMPGVTTTDLATRSRISLASASEHATTLRQARLITSRRDGNRIHHHPTTTGTVLLNAPANATGTMGR